MAVHPRSLKVVSLCTGGGGLDRAFELAIPAARTVVCVEREAFSVANLVAQMRQRVMAEAAVHSDVRTFPGRRCRGGVDGVIGGIPCQPYSLAGKRLGREDERDLWGAARRIFVQSGAWFILIENVGGMLSEGGAERVRRDLLRLGCSVEGGLFRASEVGFPHERERLFILGVADRDGQHDHGRREFWARRRGQPADGGGELADAGGEGLQGRRPDGDRPGECSTAERGGGALGDACVSGLHGLDRRKPDAQPADGCVDVVDAASVGRREGRPEPKLRRGGRAAGRAGSPLAHADESELRRQPSAGQQPIVQQDDGDGGLDDAARLDGGLHPGSGRERPGAPHAGRSGQVVDAVSRGRDGWACEPERSAEGRAAVEWASEGPLFPPGPGDAVGWSRIAQRYPDRLPALSRHDRFRLEIGAARAAAHGDPSARPAQVWGNSAPASWLDEGGPYGLRASVVQEIAQSTLRRGSDGLASRIDELRMLGNGVVDLEGAYAVGTLVTDLARRSTGAAELVRLMGEHQ